ncbi:hypothetical protein HJFPF1_01520 [Paramyrothecium foliicola]|nr:hypothetical protein HJFPF1_01520 [Paramyrothecium foliicola]
MAPAYENICPHWAERWEIRTKPLGCQVSTITSLSSIASVVSTLAVVLIIYLAVLITRRVRRYVRERPLRERKWVRRGRLFLTRRGTREQEPLLGRAPAHEPPLSAS